MTQDVPPDPGGDPGFVTNSHARRRMIRRKVPQEAISWVLKNYDVRRPAQPLPRTKPAEILIGTYEGRRLRVYVEIGSEPLKVKTAAWED